jgi:hypothetical protein
MFNKLASECDQIHINKYYEVDKHRVAEMLEHLFNKKASEAYLLNISLHFAAALGVTKVIRAILTNLVTLCCNAQM